MKIPSGSGTRVSINWTDWGDIHMGLGGRFRGGGGGWLQGLEGL